MSVTVRGFYRTGLAGMAAAVDLRRALTSLLALATALAIGGCTTVLVRSPVPEGLIDRARPYGIDAPLSRAWGDNLSDEESTSSSRRAQGR